MDRKPKLKPERPAWPPAPLAPEYPDEFKAWFREVECRPMSMEMLWNMAAAAARAVLRAGCKPPHYP